MSGGRFAYFAPSAISCDAVALEAGFRSSALIVAKLVPSLFFSVFISLIYKTFFKSQLLTAAIAKVLDKICWVELGLICDFIHFSFQM
jgi:hypothetical protein